MIKWVDLVRDIARLENDVLLSKYDHASSIGRDSIYISPQQDHTGDWFIGFGSSVINGHKVGENYGNIDLNTAFDVLEQGVFEAYQNLTLLIERPGDINAGRVFALVNLTYQLGLRGFGDFQNFWFSFKCGDYSKAAYELIDSKMYREQNIRFRTELMAYRITEGRVVSSDEFREWAGREEWVSNLITSFST